MKSLKNSNSFPTKFFQIPISSLVFFLCLIFTSGTFLTQCEMAPQGGGSDSETITGLVTLPNGKVAALSEVKLIPSDYDPSHPDEKLITKVISDSMGKFTFNTIDKNKDYNIIVKKLNSENKSQYLWGLEMKVKGSLNGNKAIALQLSNSKVFLFSMHSDVYARADSGIAYFPGTDILTRCDGIVESPIDSVPSGALRFKVISRAGWQYDTTLTSALDTTKVLASRNELKLLP